MRDYAIAALVVYAAWCAAVYMLQDRFVFPRSLVGPGRKAGDLPRGVESIWIDAGTPDRPIRVEAWYLPPLVPANPIAAPGRIPAVVYFHGNGELIDHCVERSAEWRRRGFAVLLPEFRGYGRCAGAPSQQAIVADAQRFYDLLTARPEVDPGAIIVQGRSLGAGVACQVAATRPCRALIIESAFTSVSSFAWRMGVPAFLCRNPFRNDRVVAAFDRPLLIMHGTQDDIIPVAHGRRLRDLAKGPSYSELAGDHNSFPSDWRAYWDAIDAFVRKLGSPQ